MVGRLIDGLGKRGVFEDLNIILLGDHGMVGTCDQKLTFLDDLAPWIDLGPTVVSNPPHSSSATPDSDLELSQIVKKSERTKNWSTNQPTKGKFLKAYQKEEFPERLH
ncbi:uncharacterized pyrophosphatase/phosphodiesterase C725.05c-like [Diospyros lotus]|uniref:uncharacterized pyrophosphatase/phosphodiesterase C725.05c-like n=1 Tax=Diospyros lotus TaxID=55363 RepID=UPI00224DF364|nr:uncharacterized pyrophosphatase/phosphodiesterase C725.05c-like [Diospyros lotus]